MRTNGFINPPSCRTCLPVLLHAVAGVVELGEGGGQLIHVVAQRVEQQVFHDLLQDLREAEDALAQLPLLLVVQQDVGGLRRLLQRGLVDVGQAGDGPAGTLMSESDPTLEFTDLLLRPENSSRRYFLWYTSAFWS